MNIIVENLIATIKSKPANEWTKYQLEEFYFDISIVYYYLPSSDKEGKEVLKKTFDRIVGLLSDKRGLNLNPGKLNFIDKTSKF